MLSRALVSRRHVRAVLAVLCTATGALALSGAAQAALTHPFVGSFGSFANVQGVAVDQSTGDVYVLDTGTGEGSLFKFDAAGNPLKFTGLAGEPTSITGLKGGGEDENEIAVDNSDGPAKGDIYVAVSTSNGAQIDVIAPDGTALGTLSEATAPWGETCGVAVDPSGDVYVSVFGGSIDKYVPAANPVTNADYASSIAHASSPCNIAADSLDNVFAAKWSLGPVTRYETSQFGASSATGAIVDSAGSSVAVDPANDHIYVDERGQVAEFDAHGQPFEEPLSTFASTGPGAISGSIGIAVNGTSGATYVSDGSGHVSVFGPSPVLPKLSTSPPVDVTRTEATLRGSVDPEGPAVTDCRFEYGTTTAYGQSIPCPTDPGAGNTKVAESVPISGLQFGTIYHFRIVASNVNGTNESNDRTFATEIVFPAGIVGLPDGRLYELVSPTNKHGSEAGAPTGGTAPYIVAGIDGDELAYYGTGPIGDTPTGFDFFSTAHRTAAGWQSRGALPRGNGTQELFSTNPEYGLGFSADMKASVFGAQDFFAPEQQASIPAPNLYRYDEDGLVQWLGKPTIADPVKRKHFGGDFGRLAGASPDYSSIYFAWEGTLTAADDRVDPAQGISRAQQIRTMNGAESQAGDDGFYEWHDGVLESAGILPDGSVDPFGAAPAATLDEAAATPEQLDNQVSEDGSKAFFVSPDPQSESGRPTELYLRETAPDGTHSTVLVSRDLTLPEAAGFPAAAPDGVTPGNGEKSDGKSGGFEVVGDSYIYASPDGSRVFFESTDQLTPDAPNEGRVMEYEFDTDTDTLTYLPGVADLTGGTIHLLRSARDGADFIFVREGELELWNRGTVTAIAPLENESGGGISLSRSSTSGSVFVFQTKSSFPAFHFNNGAGAHEQIYRYDVAAATLDCVSCPPGGIAPSGDAELSHAFPDGDLDNTRFFLTGTRGLSEDGGRVFFDTPDRLLPQDSNGTRDVYEWEDGTLSLISTGVSQFDSYFGDNSPNGNDVFFSTAEGLVPGDGEENYDVYDARVPRPGDQQLPPAVPCEGAVCQGPPSVPQLFTQPASEAFDGVGNLSSPVPPSPGAAKPKSLTSKQKLARALKACKRLKHQPRKRTKCQRQARKKYGARTAATGHRGKTIGHDRRGK